MGAFALCKNLPTNQLPTELVINNECIIDSTKVASKLNEFFASVAEQFEMDNSLTDSNKIKTFVLYANMSVQFTAIFHGYKNDYFQMKNYNIFLFCSKTLIDSGYTLEPPQ